MARGWESKSVADQIEEKGVRDKQEYQSDEKDLERERRSRINSLQLSRSRILAQLELATNANHREMLNRALQSLEAEMATLPDDLKQS